MTDPGAHRRADHRGDGQGCEARVCVGSDRCYALASDVESARARCTPEGRCRVGAIVSRGGRESFDVWLEVSRGLVKLIAQVEG